MCNDLTVDLTSYGYGWAASDSSAVSMSSGGGLAHGVGAGGNITVSSIIYTPDLLRYKCPLTFLHPISDPVDIKPTISGPHDVWWFSGENPGEYPTSITLQSSSGPAIWTVTAGFDKVNINPTGDTVVVTSSGSAFSSATGDVTITAQVNYAVSNPFHITTHKPANAVQPNPFTTCDATWGYITDITYIVEDQLQNAMTAGVTWNEKWSTTVTHVHPDENWARPPEVGATSPSQYLMDEISGPGINNNPPNVPPTACPGTATEVQYWGQEFRVGTLTSGSGVLVESHNLVRYTQHAEHQ